MNRHALLVAALATTFVGCAPPDTRNASTEPQERTTVTGSRIPVRGGGSADVKAVDSRDAADSLRRGTPYIPPKAGGS
jgi:hypothetical protein